VFCNSPGSSLNQTDDDTKDLANAGLSSLGCIIVAVVKLMLATKAAKRLVYFMLRENVVDAE
jgi:hypothetical protein